MPSHPIVQCINCPISVLYAKSAKCTQSFLKRSSENDGLFNTSFLPFLVCWSIAQWIITFKNRTVRRNATVCHRRCAKRVMVFISIRNHIKGDDKIMLIKRKRNTSTWRHGLDWPQRASAVTCVHCDVTRKIIGYLENCSCFRMSW